MKFEAGKWYKWKNTGINYLCVGTGRHIVSFRDTNGTIFSYPLSYAHKWLPVEEKPKPKFSISYWK